MASRNPQFSEKQLVDTTPLPASIPKVKELGASSAPLQSASFFIGARCKDYNDDFMKCKTENPGKGEFECLKEGRRVTRCARSVETGIRIVDCLTHKALADMHGSIEDINKSCLEEFRAHYECLDNNNQQLWQCRPAEWRLNKCVFHNLKLEKTIPDAAGKIPVHQRSQQIYAHAPIPFQPHAKYDDAKSS